MPQIRDIALEQLTAGDALVGVTETRVDPAHSIGDALVRPPALAEMPVAEAITDLVRVEGAVQLQSQADQLAAHLRQRQQELDRREAQLNSRLADFDKEVREARLWLAERNDELNEREAKCEGSGDHAAHGARVQGSVSTVDDRTPSVGNALRGVPQPTAGFADTATPGHLAEGVGYRAPHNRTASAEWAEQKVALSQKSEELDRRRGELELFREKVSQMHREALELRLAAEQVQAELHASLGAERADDAVALARQRLARYFDDEQAELTRKREELEWLKLDLAAEHDRLERLYEQLKEPAESNGVDSTSHHPRLTRH
ncbi:MAG: hypothetical protein ACREHD_11385 [Pirellulales bacterium]